MAKAKLKWESEGPTVGIGLDILSASHEGDTPG